MGAARSSARHINPARQGGQVAITLTTSVFVRPNLFECLQTDLSKLISDQKPGTGLTFFGNFVDVNDSGNYLKFTPTGSASDLVYAVLVEIDYQLDAADDKLINKIIQCIRDRIQLGNNEKLSNVTYRLVFVLRKAEIQL